MWRGKSDNDKVVVRLRSIIDDMASQGYTTKEKILRSYFGKQIEKWENVLKTNEAKSLKTLISSELKGIIEYSNGENVKNGFRYKEGFEYFFARREEYDRFQKMSGDKKKLFQTAGLQMLFDDDILSDPRIEFEFIGRLNNLALVKFLSHYIGENVITFQYLQGFKHPMEITMHPHLLKEYNSRWFIFGYIEQKDGSLVVSNCTLDRINCNENSLKGFKIHDKSEKPIILPPRGFYQKYFEEIVGVTKDESKAVETIVFRTTDFIVDHLIDTKPIHSSQERIRDFIEGQQEGEFKIKVIPNIELQTRLLSYGPGLYVVGNGEFQKQIRKAVSRMAELYR